jgi:hypothetical protein
VGITGRGSSEVGPAWTGTDQSRVIQSTGREPIGHDLYLLTVFYSAAGRRESQRSRGLAPTDVPVSRLEHRPTCRSPRPDRPRIGHPLHARGIRGMAAQASRQTRRGSRRSSRPLRQAASLSSQRAWQRRAARRLPPARHRSPVWAGTLANLTASKEFRAVQCLGERVLDPRPSAHHTALTAYVSSRFPSRAASTEAVHSGRPTGLR